MTAPEDQETPAPTQRLTDSEWAAMKARFVPTPEALHELLTSREPLVWRNGRLERDESPGSAGFVISSVPGGGRLRKR